MNRMAHAAVAAALAAAVTGLAMSSTAYAAPDHSAVSTASTAAVGKTLDGRGGLESGVSGGAKSALPKSLRVAPNCPSGCRQGPATGTLPDAPVRVAPNCTTCIKQPPGVRPLPPESDPTAA